MGCPCRQIRQVVAHLPGGRALIGRLPQLPRSKGPTMRMQTTPGQRIFTISGRHYAADQDGVILEVDPEDVSELSRVGCRIVPAEIPTPPAAPTPEQVAELETAVAVAEGQPGTEVAVVRNSEEITVTVELDPAAAGHHEAPERSE
jgi:hypothetical protein